MCASPWSLRNCFDAWCKRVERRSIFGLDSTVTEDIYHGSDTMLCFCLHGHRGVYGDVFRDREAFYHCNVSIAWSSFDTRCSVLVVFYMGLALVWIWLFISVCFAQFSFFFFSWDSPFHLQCDFASLQGEQSVCIVQGEAEKLRSSVRAYDIGVCGTLFYLISGFAFQRQKGWAKRGMGFCRYWCLLVWYSIVVGLFSPFLLFVFLLQWPLFDTDLFVHFLWSVVIWPELFLKNFFYFLI